MTRTRKKYRNHLVALTRQCVNHSNPFLPVLFVPNVMCGWPKPQEKICDNVHTMAFKHSFPKFYSGRGPVIKAAPCIEQRANR